MIDQKCDQIIKKILKNYSHGWFIVKVEFKLK